MDAYYPKGLEAFGNAEIDWLDDTIRVVLVDITEYTFSEVDQFLSSIPVGARISTSGALTGKTNVGGVLDAADVTLYSVSGDDIEALVIYKDTGSAATSPLICYRESFTVNGGAPPFSPDGSDVVIRWSNGANKIMKL